MDGHHPKKPRRTQGKHGTGKAGETRTEAKCDVCAAICLTSYPQQWLRKADGSSMLLCWGCAEARLDVLKSLRGRLAQAMVYDMPAEVQRLEAMARRFAL